MEETPLLSALVVLIFFLASNAHAEPPSSGQSWITGITHQMEKLKLPCQIEARSIIEKVTKAAKQPQNCAVAEQLGLEAREIGRKSLKSKSLNEPEDVRYPKLLVFVSFSMPMETLKTLARDVNRLGGKLVLRGLVNGKFTETLTKLQELQEEILIDPTLFEAYQVESVPTFILRDQNTESAEEKVKHDTLRGNVSLRFVLEQFAVKGDVSELAEQLLQNLKEKP